MTRALVGMYLREETHLHEFGSPSFLLLNRTREVRFRLLVIPLFLGVYIVVLFVSYKSYRYPIDVLSWSPNGRETDR